MTHARLGGWHAAAFAGMLGMGIVSCQPLKPAPYVLQQAPAISGRIVPAARAVQALATDIANGATVSLIDSATGQTIVTTVSTSTGAFNLFLNPGFTPTDGSIYYLEAVKGLPVGGSANRAGAPAARMRTLLLYQAGSWTSLSSAVPGDNVAIGWGTTALSVIASLRNLSSPQLASLIGHLNGGTFDPTGTPVGAGDYTTVYSLVSLAVTHDQDPLEAISFDASGATPEAQYGRKAGTLVINDTFTPAKGTAGGTMTFSGQNFPGPGSGASVMVGPQPVSWSVNAKHTQLTITLPANAYGGTLIITQGKSTWAGPYVPVAGTIGTFAGSGQRALVDGKGALASFNDPAALKIDASGNLYLADGTNSAIRKITPNGTVTTLAGNGTTGYADGVGTAAMFNVPWGLGVDRNTGIVYVADTSNHRIRKITPDGTVTTFAGSGVAGYADGTGTAAQFNNPLDVAVDSAGNLFVPDQSNCRIRKITPAGLVTTFAGSSTSGVADGAGTAAQFGDMGEITVDVANNLYLTERTYATIRKITPAGAVTTFAGNGAGYAEGTGTSALFAWPIGVALDANGNLFVTDSSNYRLRKITPAGVTSTLAGNGTPTNHDGPLAQAGISPWNRGIVLDAAGNIYFGDAATHRIRVYTP